MLSILPFKSSKEFFEKKQIFFSTKNSSFEIIEIASAIITFEMHSKWKYPCLVFLKTFKCFPGEKTSVFPKKPKIWRSWELMSNSKNRDTIWKNLQN